MYGYNIGLYRDNGTENGNYYSRLSRSSTLDCWGLPRLHRSNKEQPSTSAL